MLEDGAQHGVVGGQAGHAHAPALEVARAPDAPAGDHRGERTLDEGAHAHEVVAALAGEGKVVDVHHPEVGAPGRQELDRVAGGGRHAHLEVHAVALVGAVPDRGVDAGVHGVGLEVERQPDRLERRRARSRSRARRGARPRPRSR